LVKTLKAQGYQVITVFFSGRPLVVDALKHSDAFIAGFLPGTQAGPALVDLIFAQDNTVFEGRLPMTWPIAVSNTSRFHGKPSQFPGTNSDWLSSLNSGGTHEVPVGDDHPYPYGYGLTTLGGH
jgi:beta-glucosidase